MNKEDIIKERIKTILIAAVSLLVWTVICFKIINNVKFILLWSVVFPILYLRNRSKRLHDTETKSIT